MASTGNVFPTSGTSVDRAGATAWTNPGNVVSDNTTDTTSAVPTDYLVCTGFGFTIPIGSTINGVTVRVEASETGTGSSNYIPQLISAATPTLIGSAKSAVTVNGTTKVISTNGSTSDVWGASLTPDIVNAAGFGVALWSTDTTNTLLIDYVTIAIEYTPLTVPSGATTFTGYAPTVEVTVSAQVAVSWVQLVAPAYVDLNTSISVGAGTLTATGYAPTAGQSVTCNPSAGTLTATGYAPTIRNDVFSYPAAASLTASGIAPSLLTNYNINVSAGSVVATGFAPQGTRTDHQYVGPPAGTLVVTGVVPTTSQTANILTAPPAGAVTISGTVPTLQAGDNFYAYPTAGTLTATGYAPTLVGRQVTVSWVQFIAPAVIGNQQVDVSVGAIAFVGASPTLQLSDHRLVYPTAGTLTATGYVPTLQADQNKSINVGATTLTAIGAVPVVQVSDYRFVYPTVGSITLTGVAPTLVGRQVKVSWVQMVAPTETAIYKYPPAGAITFTGFQPYPDKFITVPSGSLTATGFAPVAARAGSSSPPSRAVTFTGQAVSIIRTVQVDILWDDIAAETGYRIRWGTASNTYTYIDEVAANVTSYRATLTYGTTYFFRVYGLVGSLEQEPGAEIILTAGYGFEAPAATVSFTGYAPAAVISGAITCYPPAGALTATGFAPSADQSVDHSENPPATTLTLAGIPPQVVIGAYRNVKVTWAQLVSPKSLVASSIDVPSGSIGITGYPPVAHVPDAIYPPAGLISVTGHAPVVNRQRSVTFYWDDLVGETGYRIKWGTASNTYTNQADVGANITSYVITRLTYGQTYYVRVYGLVGSVEQTESNETVFTAGYGFEIGVASVAFTGFAPQVLISGPISKLVPATTVSITRYPPVILTDKFAAPGAGSITITGHPSYPVPTEHHVVYPGAGSIDFAGIAPTLREDAFSYPGAGTLTLTGSDTGYAYDTTVYPGAGTLAVVCSPVEVWGPVEREVGATTLSFVSRDFYTVISPDELKVPYFGTISFTGFAPRVSVDQSVYPGSGSISVVGQGVTTDFGTRVYPGAGTLTITGYEPVREGVVALAGTFTATAAFTGSFGIPKYLTNAPLPQAGTVNGYRMNGLQFNGALNDQFAVASWTGALSTAPLLAGTFEATASWSGDLALNEFLAGEIRSEVTFVADLSVIRQVRLAGDLQCTAAFLGRLSVATATYDIDFTIVDAGAKMSAVPETIRMRDITTSDIRYKIVDAGSIQARKV